MSLQRIFTLVALLLVVAILIVAASRSQKTEPIGQQNPAVRNKRQKGPTVLKAELVRTLPLAFSKVKDLQVTGATLLNEGTPQAAISLDIVNNSDQAVISLELMSGDANDWSGLGIDGIEDPDKPEVAIPPHSLKTFRWFLGEVLEGYPIVITGAIFADGTEDGDRRSLDIMHRDRERNREKKARGGRQ